MSWDVKGKIILVTGATSGIGLEASAELAKLGAKVILVGRDRARTEAAVAVVKSRSGYEAPYFLCDFSSQKSIRAFAADFLAKHDRLDVLVNNAGGVNAKRKVTEDGIEATFAVNHLGYFLLTNLLLDLLVKSAPARVVVVASTGHYRGTMDFDDLGFEKGGYSVMASYSRSKLANVLFSNELARRYGSKGITSNSLHPGAVDTNIWSSAPGWTKPILNVFVRPFFISAEEGAKPIIRLASSADLDGVSGRYYERAKEKAASPLALDEALAKRLWGVSAKMVGLA